MFKLNKNKTISAAIITGALLFPLHGMSANSADQLEQTPQTFRTHTSYVSPSGTYLTVGEKLIFMPGVYLDSSVLKAILRAGGDVVWVRLPYYDEGNQANQAFSRHSTKKKRPF